LIVKNVEEYTTIWPVVLPNSKADAKSMKEIAQAMGLEITIHMDWFRAERKLARSLRSLIRWSWVAYEQRQREDGHKFWYNAYWKTEVGKQSKPP
jgi:hypothetical protein